MSDKRSTRSVINISDVALSNREEGEQFESQLGAMASEFGAEQLGCRLVVVPTGKRAWPFHSHHANEEMFSSLRVPARIASATNRIPLSRVIY